MNVFTDLNIIKTFANTKKLKIGDDIDNVLITDNFLLNGKFTAWTDLVQPAAYTRRGANDKPDFNYDDLTLRFPQDNPDEIVYYNIQMPHNWKGGSDIFPHVHFIQNQNVTPIFKMDYNWISLGEQVSTTWPTYIINTLIKTYTYGNMSQIVHSTIGLPSTNRKISDILQCRLYRDDNVYIDDCSVLSFDIHYEIDSFGSKDEYQKY